VPNAFAYIALLGWPLVAAVLFRRVSLPVALVWTILGGYLFLPSLPAFDFPFLPAIDKDMIPSVSAAILCFFIIRQADIQRRTQHLQLARAESKQHPQPPQPPQPRARIKPDGAGRKTEKTGRPAAIWIIRLLILAYIVAPLLTAATNPDPIVVGRAGLPGLGVRDAFSGSLRALVALLPFLLARRYLADVSAQTNILRGFCIAGLIYSLLALFEVRMSPQLNVNFFGYFPSAWAQHVRGGSWRPIIFLQHGLWLGIFFSMSILSAMTLFRYSTGKARLKYLLAILWLVPVLILSKNLGALIITTVLAPFLLLTNIRIKLLMAATVVAVVLSFPALRGAGLIPVDKVYTTVKSFNVARAESLNTRLKNEDILLQKANQKPAFGWGGWGRSRVFDTTTGRDVSITDGLWVIIIGLSGWFGYLATFGLLCIPTFLLAWRQRAQLTGVTAGLVIVLCANLIDLIPNATLTPLTWLVAGAIAGYYQRSLAQSPQDQPQADTIRAPARFARAGRRPQTTPAI